MYRCLLALHAALCLVTSGCLFATAITDDARVTCNASPCPDGWSCRLDTGFCVPQDAPCLTFLENNESAQPAVDGSACDDGICVSGNCQPPICGDGVRSQDEECDDGNSIDTDACLSNCVRASCGDGFLQLAVEECDDGNQLNEDSCLNNCTQNRCGDGNVNPDIEECDDGNQDDGDACLSSCIVNRCGDGFLNAIDEECDDGNNSDDDACRNNCRTPICGDGAVQVGVEECDDGNDINGDGCLNTCTYNQCGDGFVNLDIEECDDGNDSNRDACLVLCIRNVCGDGFLNEGQELCDDGDADSRNGCKVDCTPNLCGDGFLYVGVENCDDGNTRSGDGCTRDCSKVEVCGDGTLDEGEACDDGNDNQFDLCQNCRIVGWSADVLVGFGPGNGEPDALPLMSVALGIDRDGTVYLSNMSDSYLYRYEPRYEKLIRFAGTGAFTDTQTRGKRLAHQVNVAGVNDVRPDGRSRLILTDLDEAQVRRLDLRTGEITVIAGTGEQGYDGDGLPGTLATLHFPESAVADGAGNIFVADSLNHRIRKIDAQTGVISTVAGTGEPGFSGDNGPPHLAQLFKPRALEFDSKGNLYFLDRRNDRIRKLEVNPDNRNQFERIVTVVGDGTPYDPNETGLLRGISGSSALSDIALSPDGTIIYFIQRGKFAVFAADLVNEEVSVIAGSLNETGFVDDVHAMAARFGQLERVAVAHDGVIYVLDSENGRLRRIAPADGGQDLVVRTVAGANPVIAQNTVFDLVPVIVQQMQSGYALGRRASCVDMPYQYDIYASLPSAHRIYQRQCNGRVLTVAGTGVAGFSGDDGDALHAQLNHPNGVYWHDETGLYVADTGNHRLRLVQLDGELVTIAGTGEAGYEGDEGPGNQALLSSPTDVAMDDQGRLLIVDSGNHRIRRLDLDTGLITSVVGTGEFRKSEDGAAPLTRALQQPVNGVFAPASEFLEGATGGAFIFSERAGHRIRVWLDIQNTGLPLPIAPRLFTLAGDGVMGDLDDDDGLRARFRYPRAISWYGGSECNGPCLLVLDGYDRIRLLELSSSPFGGELLQASVRTLRGSRQPMYDGPFSKAQLQGPSAIVGIHDEQAIVSERSTGRLRRVDFAAQEITTISGFPLGNDQGPEAVPIAEAAPLFAPADMVLDTTSTPMSIYVAERTAHTLRKVVLHDLAAPETWTISLFAGSKHISGHRDGHVLDTLFDGPNGLAIDAESQKLYVSEFNNQTIRKIDLSTGEVTTLAGTPGQIGSFGDNTPAVEALFHHPGGLAISPSTSTVAKSLYVADTDNHQVRRIDNVDGESPFIFTVLGDGSASSSGEGGPAKFFPVNSPSSIFLDPGNNLYSTSADAIRLLLAHDDNFSDGNDEVASIYGSAPRDLFPEPITTCVHDFYFNDGGNEIYAIDECLGIILRLRKDMNTSP